MKKKTRIKNRRNNRRSWTHPVVAGMVVMLGTGAARAEDNDTSFEGPEDAGSNWIELGIGDLFSRKNTAQAEQTRRLPENLFGGVEDFHFQKEVAKATTFSVDGRGLFDLHDYRLALGLEKEERYFIKLNYREFRTWSNGDGGYYPPTDQLYSLYDRALTLDRGEFSVEGGLTLEKLPALHFKYTYWFRDGQKGSTIWGPTHPGLVFPASGFTPTILAIDEDRHIFEFDAKQRIKSTDVGLGFRYEFGDLNNARKLSFYPGEPPVAGVPQDRKVTDRQNSSYDLLSVHAFSETWLKENLFFSAGFLFSDLDNDVTGSRIWGNDFDVLFVPNAGNGQGYTNLLSNARKHDYVLNLNLMSQPARALTVTPSIRVERQDWDADSTAFSTYANSLFGATGSSSDADAIDVTERLDVRYGGITNWVFSARGEWNEGQGNLREFGGIFNDATGPGAPIARKTEATRFFQKYSLSAKWYPARRLNFDVGGYYKRNSYDYDHKLDSTPNNGIGDRYPAYLTLQDFDTYDGNARMTWRPFTSLTLVSRYEYQFATIHTTPDPVSGLSEDESARMTSHIFAQNASWSPWSRWYLQVGFNYVISDLKTPARDYTAAVLKAQNNYWNVNCNTGFVLSDKTDLTLGYSFYRADNYKDNSPAGLPFGSGAQEHGVSAALSHRFNKNLRGTLRYGYYAYTDDSARIYRDYDAHVVYSGLQYRF